MNLKSVRDVHILQSWSCNVAFSEAKRYDMKAWSFGLRSFHKKSISRAAQGLSPSGSSRRSWATLAQCPSKKSCDLCSVYSAGCTTVTTVYNAFKNKINQSVIWRDCQPVSLQLHTKRNLLKFTSSQDSEMDTPTRMAVFLPTVRRPKHPVPTSRHWRHARKPGGTQKDISLLCISIFTYLPWVENDHIQGEM